MSGETKLLLAFALVMIAFKLLSTDSAPTDIEYEEN
jgi:hypothetical protein